MIEKINPVLLRPRRAAGAGHVEQDIEDLFEIIVEKLNELTDAVNSLYNPAGEDKKPQ